MAKVLEKYEETISAMIDDAKAAVADAKHVHAEKQKACRVLENQLKEIETKQKENSDQFLYVAKEFFMLLIKNFFKKSAFKDLPKVINPINEYIKYSNWAVEARDKLKVAKDEESAALSSLTSAEKLLKNIKSIVG